MKRIRTIVREGALPGRLLFVTVWLSLFAYAGRPLLVAAHAGGIAPGIAWLSLLLCSALPLMAVLIRRPSTHLIGYATLGVFSLLLVLVAFSDVVRLSYLLAHVAINSRAVSFSVLGTAVALSVVGLFQARCPRVKNVTIALENLPDEFDGYRIVQWSDVHVGPQIQRSFVQALVDRTNALEADAVAITGDLVDGYLDDLREQVQPLAQLRPRDGVFYVTGNHEYYWRASEWIKELQTLGLDFLKNEHRVIARGDAKLVIAGVTDPAGRDTHKQDVGGALENAPAGSTKILLSHRPQTAQAASRHGADIQLSGHTHGGQFFPFNLLIRFFQPIVAGLHRVERTWLYVSRGTGYWGPPSRLGVQGEITVITLKSS
jgi:predicted MPP superfamily phosphohydrolase